MYELPERAGANVKRTPSLDSVRRQKDETNKRYLMENPNRSWGLEALLDTDMETIHDLALDVRRRYRSNRGYLRGRPAAPPARPQRRPSVESMDLYRYPIRPDAPGGDDVLPIDLGTVPLWGGSDAPQAAHVDQGNVGNCWLLATLAAFAQAAPELLRSLIEPQENGRFLVHLDRPVEVGPIVEGYFGYDTEEVYNQHASSKDAAWVAIMEKAAARRNPDAIRRLARSLYDMLRDGDLFTVEDSYFALHYGDVKDALRILRWRDSKAFDMESDEGRTDEAKTSVVAEIEKALSEGRPVVVNLPNSSHTGSHSIAILSRTEDGFLMYNPYGRTEACSTEEFLRDARDVFIAGEFQPVTRP